MAQQNQVASNTRKLHFIGRIVHSLLWLRWQVSRLFQTKVLPKRTPPVKIPNLENLRYLTYGEVLSTVPLLLLLFAGFYFTFASPDVANSGNVDAFAMVLVFLTANKTNSIFSLLFGVPFERLIGYHKLAASVTVVLTALHTYSAYWEEAEDDVSSGSKQIKDEVYTSGLVVTVTLVLLVITSFFSVFRRRFFDMWLAAHIILIIGVAVSCFVHSAFVVVFAAVWWLIDLIIRYAIKASCIHPSIATLRKLHPDVVEIRFPKPQHFHYKPGQFLRIAIPELATWQFHPISISSAPHEEEVTLHVRALGDWTKRLLQLAEDNEGNDIKIWIEGPYGILSVDLDNELYGMALCVSGGIGVTHCRSVARSLLHDHHCNGRKLKQLRFVWAVRDYNLVKDLPPFEDVSSHESGSSAEAPDNFLIHTEVYLTKSTNTDDIESLSSRNEGCQLVVRDGRPDFDKILSEMRDEAIANDAKHIAVFGCGPQTQTDALKEACRKLSDSKGVYFDLHLEVFEF